jgi:Mg-chelatase subunit ChlD
MPTQKPMRLRRSGLVLALAVALFAGAAAAQSGPSTSLEGYGLKIYRVESGLYPFVQVYFRTFDQELDPLVNLNYANVGLLVKGRSYDPRKAQYAIQPLRQRGEAVRTVLVLDASRSMAGKPFEDSLRAAAAFIDGKRPQDQVSILAIRDTQNGYDVVSNWERDADALGRRLADVRADGQRTRLYDTLAAAMQMAGMVAQESTSPGVGDYAASSSILVFSDGQDDGSALSREELNARITSLEIPVPIYSVAYSKVSDAHFKNLEALSKNSFGVYIPIGDATDRMQRSVERIQNILLGDYVVTFRAFVPVDGESHAFKLGIEYPSGSGKFSYQSARFEALEPPPAKVIADQIAAISARMPAPPDRDPYLKTELPGVAAGSR